VFVCVRVEESYDVVEMKHVDIQNGEGVYVTWVGDPSDFRVCIQHVILQLSTRSSIRLSVSFTTSRVDAASGRRMSRL